MSRREPFKTLFELPVGEQVLVEPNVGESPAEALKRLKLRLSKWRPEGRSYIAEIEGGMVRVRRVELGANKKLWRWTEMRAGETMILNDQPTEADIRSARNTAAYLMARTTATGYWQISVDGQGRLVARCYVDAEGNSISSASKATTRPETEAERALRTASLHRGSAKFSREEAARASDGTKRWLTRISEEYQKMALDEEAKAELLRIEEGGTEK